MTFTARELRDLLSFYAAESSAHNIISLALTEANQSGRISSGLPQDDTDIMMTSSSSERTLLNLAINFADIFAENSASNSTLSGEDIDDIEDALNGTTLAEIARNGTESGPIIPSISPEMPIWLIPCYSIILLFAIVGNLLVISTLVQNRRMRTITNLFLLNLAISDILLGVLCMPVTLVGTLLRHFIFGEFFCKVIPFSQATSVAVSSWTLVAISCERYYAICHPLRSRTWQTINHAYKIIGFIWFGSMTCMTPIFAFSRLMPTSRQGLRKCREYWPDYAEGYERSYNLFLDLILLVLPLLILCVAYILITRTLYVGMKNERAMIFGGTSSMNKVTTQVDAVTTTLMPSSSFNWNMSFRCHKQRNNVNHKNGGGGGGNSGSTSIGGGGGGNDNGSGKTGKPGCEMVVASANNNSSGGSGGGSAAGLVVAQRKQRQRHQQTPKCFDDVSRAGSKRKLLAASDGRRHLYCMRTASMKSLNKTGNNNNAQGSGGGGGGGGGSSPSPSMTVINMPQQQRFQLHQQRQQHHDSERRKSNSTPSLRITDAALRRSNETKNLESKKRVVKMLFVLVLEFFICWTPLYVINTTTIFIGPKIYEYVSYTSISFFQLLAYSSSCCNPITYCFMNAGFRRAFLDTFKGMHLSGGRIWRKRPKTGTSLSVAGNSIAMANSGTMMSTNTMLDSPRL